MNASAVRSLRRCITHITIYSNDCNNSAKSFRSCIHLISFVFVVERDVCMYQYTLEGGWW